MFDRDTLNRLYRYAFTLRGDQASAYDLLQDTLERCLKHPPDKLQSPEAFARRVMRNRFIDQTRQQRYQEQTHAEADAAELLAIDTHCLEDLVIKQDQLEHIWSELDDKEREILYYWAVEDMTAAQIASLTDSRRGTILSRIHRLRQRLRNSLNAQPDDKGGAR